LNLLQVYNHEKRKENFSLIIPTAIRLVQHFSAAFFLPFVLKFVRHETGHNFDYTFVCNSVWPTDSLSLFLSLSLYFLSLYHFLIFALSFSSLRSYFKRFLHLNTFIIFLSSFVHFYPPLSLPLTFCFFSFPFFCFFCFIFFISC